MQGDSRFSLIHVRAGNHNGLDIRTTKQNIGAQHPIGFPDEIRIIIKSEFDGFQHGLFLLLFGGSRFLGFVARGIIRVFFLAILRAIASVAFVIGVRDLA